MKVQNVDLVLVVDASDSMGPCFDQLKAHLTDLLYPLQQASFRVRFGLVAYAAGKDRAQVVYDHTFIGGSGAELIRRLYSPQVRSEDFFTNDPANVIRALAGVTPRGNEDTLVAIDVAADFPFGSAESTRRVIAVFTDEPLEAGILGDEPIAKIPQLIEKLMQRRIQLFVSAPLSPGLEALATVDRAEIETVPGGDGLRSLDFSKLLNQMARSISISSMQAGREPAWARAIFGQDQWSEGKSASDTTRRVVLSVGESTMLNNSTPISRVNIKLRWTAPVDLDLHAFCRSKSGIETHVYFGDRAQPGIVLDTDAGIGDVGGQNEENITLTDVDGFESILFATKIFKKGGSFADYDGRVVLQTDNGDDISVPLTAQARADWCVIAKLSNTSSGPTVTNLNQVTNADPSISSF